MGFFGDLKNKVTGGAATVNVQVPSVRRGQAATITVQAIAKANGKVSAVYLLVRGTEKCAWREDGKDVGSSVTSFENKITIAGAQDLKQGETYTWEGQIELPGNSLPTLNGKLIDHTWEIQAGLDMPGNDPDSGWQSFQVS